MGACPGCAPELASNDAVCYAFRSGLLDNLPQSPVAAPAEVLHFIDNHRLMGLGVGYVDMQLLAATALAEDALLWTSDKRLPRIAGVMQLEFVE